MKLTTLDHASEQELATVFCIVARSSPPVNDDDTPAVPTVPGLLTHCQELVRNSRYDRPYDGPKSDESDERESDDEEEDDTPIFMH